MKTINVLLLCLALLLSMNCYAKELNKGQITGNLEQKVKILTGDKAITNLGKKSGVIKGDILTIYKQNDTEYLNPIGKCAVVNVNDTTSICEITKINSSEIAKDAVVIDKLSINDVSLYPAIFQLLTKVVEPYEPYKDIVVHIHAIFDEQNNITKLSEKIQKEIGRIFYQKKRIVKYNGKISQALKAYLPAEYADSNDIIEDYLKKEKIDVLVAGTYSIKDNKIVLTLYKIDRHYDDIVIDTSLSSAEYKDLMSNIVTTYKPVKKEKSIVGEVIYKPVYHRITARDERNSIIYAEAQNDPFLEYNLNRTSFNIISPVDFKMIIDNNEIDFDKNKVQKVPMTTGKHEITAKFKKGYYFNDSLLFTNEAEVKKNIVVMLDNPEDIKIEVTANAVPGKENIEFKVFKKSDKSRPDFKPVLPQKNDVKIIETFKD